MKMIKNFLKDESGMETAEYAVIAGLIAVAAAIIYAAMVVGPTPSKSDWPTLRLKAKRN